MKFKIFFIGLISFVTLLMVQCSKSNLTDEGANTPKKNGIFDVLATGDINYTDFNGGESCIDASANCSKSRIGRMVIPEFDDPSIPVGSCEIYAEFVMVKCDRGLHQNPRWIYSFSNFVMGIPSGPECQDLMNYIANLSDEDRDAFYRTLRYAVRNQAVDIIMHNEVSGNNYLCSASAAEARIFDPKCYRKCWTIGNENPDPNGPPQTVWIYRYVDCGNACCMEATTWCLDENGSPKKGETYKYSLGSCTGPPPTEVDWCYGDPFDPKSKDSYPPCGQQNSCY